MHQTREVALVIRKAARRRRSLLIITPLFFLSLSIAAIYLIEPKYTSSTSILVEQEETLNPLVIYDISSDNQETDRSQSLNELIYSRSSMEMLIDSLDLNSEVTNNSEKQALIERLRKAIQIRNESTDSFEISFTSTDPVKARDGVEILSDYYINSRLRIETRRNDEAVEFFTEKLSELETLVNEQRNETANVTTDRMRVSPMDVSMLQSRLRELDTRFETLEVQIFQKEQTLDLFQQFADEAEGDIQLLYRLSLDDIPHGEELGELLAEHDDLSERYTENYPGIRSLSNQIRRIADRIPSALESELGRLNQQMSDLSNQRAQLISEMEQSFVASQRESSQQSDYNIYEGLYNEMRVKLEQARMAQEIGYRGAEQFVILDEPVIPEDRSSPNITLLLTVGMVLGLIFGVIVSAVAEVLDTTIRDEMDLQYQKPVIAYLTNG